MAKILDTLFGSPEGPKGMSGQPKGSPEGPKGMSVSLEDRTPPTAEQMEAAKNLLDKTVADRADKMKAAGHG